MTARHQVSQAALELIKHFEGYRPRAARLADGRWTIGYGHTLTARDGAEVSLEDAEALLIYDLQPIAAAVNDLTFTPLTQNQFDALAAFVYNIGLENFRHSAVLRRINEGNLIQAAFALELWRKAEFEGEPIVVDALVRRRAAEKAMFLTPSEGWMPAPSQVLRPRMDLDAKVPTPEAAMELETPMTGDVAQAHRAPGTPIEESSASLAAAVAISARLHEILPDVEPQIERAPEAPRFEPELAPQPEPEPAIERPPESIEPAKVEPEPESEPAAVSQPVAETSSTAAFFGALFARDAETPPAAPSERSAPAAEPTPAGPTPTPTESMDLSRQVVWREAPAEAESARRSPLTIDAFGADLPLIVLFLFGLIVFAGGLTWGMAGTNTGSVSWILGLIGIVCVVSAVYVYLERLNRRED